MAAKKTVVTTGANSGIGFQTTLHLARAGARVVMACRSTDKAMEAQRRIQQEVPRADTLVIPLDVSELGSIREFCEQFAAQVGELDILINNAGIVAHPLRRTSDGHEMQLATNYLGAFALTGMLLPLFRKGQHARIVNVGSLAHRFGKLNVQDINWETTTYDEWKAYANSKVALLSHTMELNRRLRERASPIVALAAHPGFANTNIKEQYNARKKPSAFRDWFEKHMATVIPSAEMAARSVIAAATADGVGGGEYLGPGGPFELGGKPKPAKVNPEARDATLGMQLWKVSETLTGQTYLSES